MLYCTSFELRAKGREQDCTIVVSEGYLREWSRFTTTTKHSEGQNEDHDLSSTV